VRAEKTKEALARYNLLSGRAALALDLWNAIHGTEYRMLRELPVETGEQAREALEGIRLAEVGRLLGKSEQQVRMDYGDAPDGEYDPAGRLEQFLITNRCTQQMAEGFRREDRGLLGRAATANHEASKRLLGNIVPEVDYLKQSALELGAVAASGFGAGFGGSAYAVCEKVGVEDFAEAWAAKYRGRFAERAEACEFFQALACDGAGRMFER
jgi:galactokinase